MRENSTIELNALILVMDKYYILSLRMVKHNHAIPNVHLRKHWNHLVKTFFNQPAKKKSRQIAREAKAAKLFPRYIPN